MAMDRGAAHAYVYAKASGMLSKSFVGKRARQLFNVTSLHELWSLLFTEAVPLVPETILAKKIERTAEKKFIREYVNLLSSYDNTAPLLISLLHFYDYDSIKELGAALSLGEKKQPHYADIRPYNIIAYEKWPDIAAMTKNKSLSWYNSIPKLTEQQQNDFKLDVQYIQEVWASISGMEKECQPALKKLLGEKFRMENLLWALRLRIYYHMSNEEITSRLAYAGSKSADRFLQKDALQCLAWDLDSYDQWKNWKFSSLLNPHEEGSVWTVDPRWISSSYTKLFSQNAQKLFHQFPGTSCPLACWFLIKQRELDNIRTASEHLRLSTNKERALFAAGLSEVRNG